MRPASIIIRVGRVIDLQKQRGSGSLLNSFRYAFNGLRYCLSTQRNMRIHFSMAILVSIFGCFYGLSAIEWIVLYCTITFVIVCEMVNTAIENAVDAATRKYDDNARIAKDVAAGAVVVAAILAVLVAGFLFLHMDKLWVAFSRIFSSPWYVMGLVLLLLLLFIWIFKPGRRKRK